jgi:hypothetical protein
MEVAEGDLVVVQVHGIFELLRAVSGSTEQVNPLL